MRLTKRVSVGHGEFAATVGRLFGATVLCQFAVLGATLAAATWFQPQDFALYGAALAIAAITNSFNTLAVETRIAVVDRKLAATLLKVGMSSALAVSLTMGAGAVVLSWFWLNDWSATLAIAAVGAWASAKQQLFTVVALRFDAARLLVRSRVVQGTSNAALILSLGWLPVPGYVALSGAWALSVLLGLIPVRKCWIRQPGDRRRSNRSEYRAALIEVRSQPLGNLITTAASQAPSILLPLVAPPSVSGSWALVNRILNGAVSAVYSALQPVFYAKAAKRVRTQDMAGLRQSYRRWWLGLTGVAVPAFCAAGALMFEALPLLSGEWTSARDVIAPALVFWASQFVALPVSQVLQLSGRFSLHLRWSSLRFVAIAGALCCWPLVGARTGLWVWASLSAGAWVSLLALQGRVLRRISLEGRDQSRVRRSGLDEPSRT